MPQSIGFESTKFDSRKIGSYARPEHSTNQIMKHILLLATLTAAFAASAQANSWSFTLGNGAGFQWGKQPCPRVYQAPVYVVPAPVYYQRPVVYSAPQTVYMQPYQQMRPVVYPQTVIYRAEPVVIREAQCGQRTSNRHNRW